MPTCKKCSSLFPNTAAIEGKLRVLNSRRYCLACSPFGERGKAVRRRSWNDQDLITAVQTNQTISGVLRSLGLSTSPGNYKTFHAHVKRLKLDTSHFTGKAHGTRKSGGKIPLRDILKKGSSYRSNSSLRKRLLREEILDEVCVKCGQGPEWEGEPLTLQLDHINGDPTDHRLENLRILCPNCHTQTQTFCKRKGRYSHPPKICVNCGTPVSRRSTHCKSCVRPSTPTKIDWPPAPGIVKEVAETSYTAVAKRLGVSDNAVRKYLQRKLGCVPKKHRPRKDGPPPRNRTWQR